VALQARGARAQGDDTVVAVLPLAVADESLGIYSKPVANAVAERLRRETSLAVESLSLAGAAPARVSLVVDGRIVAAGKRKVKLEARVRDPLRGKTVARSVATRAGPLGKIDELAAELATELAPRLVDGAAAQKRVREAEARAVVAPTAPASGAEATAPPQPSGAVARQGEGAAGFLVIQAGAPRGNAAPSVADTATRAADWLVERLGHRAVRGHGQGVRPMAEVRRQLAETGLQYAVMLHVRKVDYRWRRQVLSARGRVRVVVVDAGGRTLFDRTARTGTQVGSRGDGHAALAHYVVIQAIDIVAPHVKRALKR
jgi:hypothetical protein